MLAVVSQNILNQTIVFHSTSKAKLDALTKIVQLAERGSATIYRFECSLELPE